MTGGEESHKSFAVLEKTFSDTIDVIRKQRDANADAIVQLSVQLMALEQHCSAQQESIKTLQKENRVLTDLYCKEKESHERTSSELVYMTENCRKMFSQIKSQEPIEELTGIIHHPV